jgi:hypothetical protein
VVFLNSQSSARARPRRFAPSTRTEYPLWSSACRTRKYPKSTRESSWCRTTSRSLNSCGSSASASSCRLRRPSSCLSTRPSRSRRRPWARSTTTSRTRTASCTLHTVARIPSAPLASDLHHRHHHPPALTSHSVYL